MSSLFPEFSDELVGQDEAPSDFHADTSQHSSCILPLWETHWFDGSNSSQPIWSSHSLEASVPSTFPPSDTCPAPPARNLSRRLSSRPAEEPVVLKSWKVSWSNSCTTAVASVFSSLAPSTRVWGNLVSPVLQTGHDGDSLHLTPTREAFQIVAAHRQLEAQRACGAGADHPQGQQHRDGEGHRDTGGSAGLPGGRSRQVLRTWGDGWLLKSEQRSVLFLGFSTFPLSFPFLPFVMKWIINAHFCHECLGWGHQIMHTAVVDSYTTV